MELDENLEELKELINDSFLDKNLRCKVKFNEETLEEEKEEYVTLKSIRALKLSEEEEFFIIDYLGSLGIFVKGNSSYYSGICDNYIQSGHFGRMDVCVLPEEKQKEYLEEYQRTKDIEVRNVIVESNLPLVKLISKKYSYLYNVEQEFLESYGVEGAILAIDQYDSTKGKLSAFISFMVRSFIWQGLITSHLGGKGNSFLTRINRERDENTEYYEYFYTKTKVEKQTGKKLKDNPELIEEIILQLINKKYCKDKELNKLGVMASIMNCYSYDQIKEKLDYVDDSSLYDEALENVFQQELIEFISDITEKLPENEKEILSLYYGLGRTEECSLDEIAKKTQVFYKTAFSRKKSAEKKMKRKLNHYAIKPKVESFLENGNHEYENNVAFAYVKKR